MGTKAATLYNKNLGGYFCKKLDPKGDKSWDGNYYRSFTEFPFQLANAKDRKGLFEILCDFSFLEKKAASVFLNENQNIGLRKYGGIYNVLDDFDLYLKYFPQKQFNSKNSKESIEFEILNSLRQFLYNRTQNYTLLPDTIFQDCYNFSKKGYMSKATRNWIKDKGKHCHPWVRRLNSPNEVPDVTRFSGHQSVITDLCITSDGRFLLSSSGTCSLYVWNIELNRIETIVEIWNPLINYIKSLKEKFLIHSTVNAVEKTSFKLPIFKNGSIRNIAIIGDVIGFLIDQSLLCLLNTNEWIPRFIRVDENNGAIEHLVASKDNFFLAGYPGIIVLDKQGIILEKIGLPPLFPNALAISLDGTTIVSTDRVGKMTILKRIGFLKWEIESTSFIRRIDNVLKLVSNGNPAIYDYEGFDLISFSLSLSTEGKLICCSLHAQDWSGEVCIFDSETLNFTQNFKNFFSYSKFSSNGKYVAFAANWNGPWKTVGIYNLELNTVNYIQLFHSNFISSFAFTLDGLYLAIGSVDGSISYAPIGCAKEREKLLQPPSPSRDEILGGILSPDKKVAACWSIDKYVMGYRLETGEIAFVTAKLGNDASSYINQIGININGEFLYVNQGREKTSCVRIWQIARNGLKLVYDTASEMRQIWEKHNRPFHGNIDPITYRSLDNYLCSFSSNGKEAAVVRIGKAVVIDLLSGDTLRETTLKLPSDCFTGSIEMQMNSTGDVFIKVPMDYGEDIILCWKSNEPEFKQIELDEELNDDTSGVFILSETEKFIIKRNYAPLGKIAEISEKTDMAFARVTARFTANVDISFVGIVPDSNQFIIGDESGEIYICVLEDGISNRLELINA